MTDVSTKVDALDWVQLTSELNSEGYVVVPELLAFTWADLCAAEYLHSLARVSLTSRDLGRGELFYFERGLPALLTSLQQRLYPHLSIIANHWNQVLGVDCHFPSDLQIFLQENQKAGQCRPISHISRLIESEYMELHQRADGDPVFPLQLVGLLSAPGDDFSGGELVMTEQRPRMQSRPMVVPLRQGDAALIATAQRPVHGSKGDYRVNLKHAVSRVHRGERIGLELSFHQGR